MTNAVDADIITELKQPETFDLGAFITSKVQFPTKDVKIILDIEGSMKAYELADEIADKQLEKEQIEEEAKGGITGGDTEAIELEIAAKHLELTNLVDELNAAALTFTLRGAAPAQWRVMHKKARIAHPVAKTATDDEKREVTIAMNESVEIETVRICTVKITSPDGEVVDGKDVTTTLIKGLYDVLEQDEWNKLKETAEAITFQVGAFDKIVSSDADFLPTSSVSDTTEAI